MQAGVIDGDYDSDPLITVRKSSYLTLFLPFSLGPLLHILP